MRFDFEKQMKFDGKALGIKSTRDKSDIGLLKSPAIRVSGSSIMFLPENPNELCDRIKILLQKKQAGNVCNKTDEEILVKRDKLIEYNCISTEQHKFFCYL